jgi:hypothetical protein
LYTSSLGIYQGSPSCSAIVALIISQLLEEEKEEPEYRFRQLLFFVMHQQRNTAQILVDIIVTNNNKIQALRPVYDSKNPMPFTEPERTAWLKTVNPDRLNKRIIGNLKP